MKPKNSAYIRIQLSKSQRGFTLIELMVVVVIIAILSAVAIPSYRAYVTQNAEAEAKSKMLLLANELEQWRAKALTYEGFVPNEGYTNAATGTINVPATNPKYVITLGKVTGTTFTFSTLANGQGTSWRMMATPTSLVTGGKTMLLSSQGLRCEVVGTVAITADDCGANSATW